MTSFHAVRKDIWSLASFVVKLPVPSVLLIVFMVMPDAYGLGLAGVQWSAFNFMTSQRVLQRLKARFNHFGSLQVSKRLLQYYCGEYDFRCVPGSMDMIIHNGSATAFHALCERWKLWQAWQCPAIGLVSVCLSIIWWNIRFVSSIRLWLPTTSALYSFGLGVETGFETVPVAEYTVWTLALNYLFCHD